MLEATFVPISQWPGEKTKVGQRRRDQFKAPYSQTLRLLEKELNYLGAKEILLQVHLDRSKIRNDGWPRAGARPSEPGVILTFKDRQGKTISMPCDRFTDWEANLRGIALSLEALRAVDRYGVTRNGEQYRGWEALPPPSDGSGMDVQGAAETLSQNSPFVIEGILKKKDVMEAAFRHAAYRTHPDKGGTSEAFNLVNQAGKVLRKHHGMA